MRKVPNRYRVFGDHQLAELIAKLDMILHKIKDAFPHLDVYAHIGDPNQATLEFDYREEE